MTKGLHSEHSDDAAELVELLCAQKATLKAIYWDATEHPERYAKWNDVAMFILLHALSIQEQSAAATILMQANRPFSTVPLARAALEGLFNLTAACNDPKFAPQKLAYELDDLASKLKQLIKNGAWLETQRPTPQECIEGAERVRRKYGVEPKHWRQAEQIARHGGLSDFYDDDYRLLSLSVHANQSGILNAGSGFLVRKGLLTLSNCLCITSFLLGRVFKVLKEHKATLDQQKEQMETLMKKPFSMDTNVAQLFRHSGEDRLRS